MYAYIQPPQLIGIYGSPRQVVSVFVPFTSTTESRVSIGVMERPVQGAVAPLGGLLGSAEGSLRPGGGSERGGREGAGWSMEVSKGRTKGWKHQGFLLEKRSLETNLV